MAIDYVEDGGSFSDYRSSTGWMDAGSINGEIDSCLFDFNGVASEIKSLGETILDSNGMLATKSKEGLEKLAASIEGLLSEREQIKGNISSTGWTLQKNYNDWWDATHPPEDDGVDISEAH